MSTSLCSYNNTLYKQQTRPKKGGKKKKSLVHRSKMPTAVVIVSIEKMGKYNVERKKKKVPTFCQHPAHPRAKLFLLSLKSFFFFSQRSRRRKRQPIKSRVVNDFQGEKTNSIITGKKKTINHQSILSVFNLCYITLDMECMVVSYIRCY